MTKAIKDVLKLNGIIVCPSCKGEGEIGYFCGHETTTECYMCIGKGIVKSLKKQKYKKICSICSGKGGLGCCKERGYHEWKTYELYETAN